MLGFHENRANLLLAEDGGSSPVSSPNRFSASGEESMH